MGFRFRKSFGKGPFKVTVSKSGVGYSAGTKGFRVTKKAGGGMRTTASIPGTGISYVKDSGGKNSGAKRNQQVTHAIPTSISAAPEDKNLAGYCKHCYRKIDGATICPACGKSQYEKVKQSAENKQAIWCMVCLIAGFILLKSAAIISFILFTVAIILAVDMAKAKKEKVYIVPKAPPVQPSAVPQTAAPEIKAGADAIVKALHEETLRQTYGDDYVDSLQEDDDSVPAASEPDTNSIAAKTHKVTGTQHYLDNILSLAHENPDYDMSKKEIIDCGMENEKIWKYSFTEQKAEVIPEPDNPHDPKAIKVVIDGKHVGYIKAGSCSHLLKMINEDRIRGIDCTIGGGPYKEVFEEFDEDSGDNAYTVQRGELNYVVKLTIYEST